MSEALQRQININLQLRRQLERARKDALLYAAQVCEDHYPSHNGRVEQVSSSVRAQHHGQLYAAKLREIAGE